MSLMEVYVHHPLHQEIRAIGGHYVLREEVRIPFRDGVLLYLKGHALMETSCCGPWGCAFIHVLGFVEGWKIAKNTEGLDITHLEPIDDIETQRRIRQLLQSKEVFHHIQFG